MVYVIESNLPWNGYSPLGNEKSKKKEYKRRSYGIPEKCQKLKHLLLFDAAEGLYEDEILKKLSISSTDLSMQLRLLKKAGFAITKDENGFIAFL